MHLLGILLALLLLAGYAVAVAFVIRRPFRGLGVLVAGMAFHNLVLMILLRLGTPGVMVRMVQAWKEGLILVLLLLVGRLGLRRWRAGSLPRPHLLDVLMGIFTLLAMLYTVVPQFVLRGVLSGPQGLVGLRTTLMIPSVYLVGRVFLPRDRRDLRWVAGVILGSAGIVGLFGLWELWFVPTATWLNWGVNQLSSWLGYAYGGPKGLPENFFQTTAQGLLLRRMVSTYVSPLGIAYTALLLLPLAAAVLSSRWNGNSRWRAAAWGASVLLLLSLFFSVTRLAFAMGIFELAALTLLLRRRFLLGATLAGVGLGFFIILAYPDLGPLVTRDLKPVLRSQGQHFLVTRDPSLIEHSGALRGDFEYVLAHPLGTGIGSSVHRFGPNTGTGESAIFDVFGDLGVLGGLIYLFMYGAVIVFGARAQLRIRGDPLAAALPLVAFVGGLGLVPITLTSSVWGDFSVTFLFWWAAGASVTLATMALHQLEGGESVLAAPAGPRNFLNR